MLKQLKDFSCDGPLGTATVLLQVEKFVVNDKLDTYRVNTAIKFTGYPLYCAAPLAVPFETTDYPRAIEMYNNCVNTAARAVGYNRQPTK